MAGSTRLRTASSKNRILLDAFISNLPFKVEIKNYFQDKKGRYIVAFVLPEENNPIVNKFVSLDLD